MPYRLKIAASAGEDLPCLPPQERQRVGAHTRPLGEGPRPPGSVKLRGACHTCRVRVGRYRVLCRVDDTERCVTILQV